MGIKNEFLKVYHHYLSWGAALWANKTELRVWYAGGDPASFAGGHKVEFNK